MELCLRPRLAALLLTLTLACGADPAGPAPPSAGTGGRSGAGAGGQSGQGGSAGNPAPPGAGGTAGAPQPSPDAAPDQGPAESDAAPDAGAADQSGADADRPAPPDGAAGPMPPLGTRWSFEETVAGRWTGPRRTVVMEEGRRIFTGGFEAGKFGGMGNGHILRFAVTPGSEYIFEYRMRFDAGFDFSRGGKIPGMSGASSPSGCMQSDGTGFSARQMWREGGSLIGYIYDMDQTGSCGNTISTGFRFTVGQWYRAKQRIKLNTGRNHDGIFEFWLDDQRLMNRTNMGWMVQAPDRRIDEVMLDFFFGGSTADWAPSRNCSISFSDLYITRVAD
jgi:hypothetical protein